MLDSDLSTETALATLGRLDIADVPDMGYEPWREAKWTRDSCRGMRSCLLTITPFTTAFAAMFLCMLYGMGGVPIVVHVLTWLMVALCASVPIAAAYAHRELAKLPDPASLLPPGSSPELAEREHALTWRIEAHNRNVRLLRGMTAIDPEALERAENEERELRDNTLALAEAKNDIAGLLTDGA